MHKETYGECDIEASFWLDFGGLHGEDCESRPVKGVFQKQEENICLPPSQSPEKKKSRSQKNVY